MPAAGWQVPLRASWQLQPSAAGNCLAMLCVPASSMQLHASLACITAHPPLRAAGEAMQSAAAASAAAPLTL
jgi:hypothetical protein